MRLLNLAILAGALESLNLVCAIINKNYIEWVAIAKISTSKKRLCAKPLNYEGAIALRKLTEMAEYDRMPYASIGFA